MRRCSNFDFFDSVSFLTSSSVSSVDVDQIFTTLSKPAVANLEKDSPLEFFSAHCITSPPRRTPFRSEKFASPLIAEVDINAVNAPLMAFASDHGFDLIFLMIPEPQFRCFIVRG